MSSHSSNICWREFLFSNWLSLSLCQNSIGYIWVGRQLGSLVCFIDLSVLLPIPHCLSYWSFNLYNIVIYSNKCIFGLHSHFCPWCYCSGTKSCPILCEPMDYRTPGFPILHYLLEFAQTHVHWVSDAIQPSCPLLLPSPPAFNLSQHQGLSQWVSSLH